jgi:hypothetical protein
MTRRDFRLVAALFVLLATLEYAIYFFRAQHFFQGDTVFWFYHRLHSLAEFLRSFASPDPGGWYRPLTNRTMQSVLYPVFGFEPAGYRSAVYLLFLANIVLVFGLAIQLTRKKTAAAIAALYFTIHTINAYTTYDLSFVPELAYTLFYTGSVIAFMRYLDSGQRHLQFAAMALFVLSLCSKEAAVTLPLTLLAAIWVSGRDLRRFAKHLIPFAVLLAAYLWFTLAYLGVASEALASLHAPPPQLETGGYYFMMGPHLTTNAGRAWAWAMNLPVGVLGAWRDATRMRSLVLWSFAVVQMVWIAYGLRVQWRLSLFGLAWFWIAALPALPLLGHFLPYYLFLPLVGFSILVGATWNIIYERAARRAPAVASALLSVVFAVLSIVCAKSARSEARNNFLLGASARTVETSLQDFRNLYPAIPPASTIFIDDAARPDLAFHQAGGGLFILASGDASLQFRYSSQKQSPSGATVRLTFRDGHLQRDPP